MLLDTHCHINFKDFKEDADEVIQKAYNEGVECIVVGAEKDTSKRAVQYAEKYERMWAVVGLHPVHLFGWEYELDGQIIQSSAEEFDYDYYKNLALHNKVVGIGEVGLDYFRIPDGESLESVKKRQMRVLEEIIELSCDVKKPLVFHIRPSKGSFDAYSDIMSIVKEKGVEKFLLHSYLGSREQAKEFLQAGAYFSFNGIITFKNAEEVRDIARYLPLDRILLETDSPYLSPDPFRGKRCEPAYVKYVAEKIAEIKNIPFEEVAQITYKNSKMFFNIE